jgi:hypothetical protein
MLHLLPFTHGGSSQTEPDRIIHCYRVRCPVYLHQIISMVLVLNDPSPKQNKECSIGIKSTTGATTSGTIYAST